MHPHKREHACSETQTCVFTNRRGPPLNFNKRICSRLTPLTTAKGVSLEQIRLFPSHHPLRRSALASLSEAAGALDLFPRGVDARHLRGRARDHLLRQPLRAQKIRVVLLRLCAVGAAWFCTTSATFRGGTSAASSARAPADDTATIAAANNMVWIFISFILLYLIKCYALLCIYAY